MKNKLFLTLACSGLVMTGCLAELSARAEQARTLSAIDTAAGSSDFMPAGFAGQFLASHFAQSQYDWKTANDYLDGVLSHDPGNDELQKRSMILAMGAGDLDLAAKRARELLVREPGNNIAILIAAVDDLVKSKPDQALAIINTMPEGDITDFVKPLIRGWAQAAQGELNTDGFNTTTVHSYNGALMAFYLNKPEDALGFARKILELGTITSFDAERTGDIFAAAGKHQEALALYQGTYGHEGGSPQLELKIAALKENRIDDLKKLLKPLQLKTAAQGAAVPLFDMANILYQEESDSSARLFANMALALDPDYAEPRILVANILARNNRYDEAIEFFARITPEHASYLEIQRYMADLLEQSGQHEKAIAQFQKLYEEQKDIFALIRVGDLYRQDEQYKEALEVYNKAAREIGDKVPEEYWGLLYARGMVYERMGKWDKAQVDLRAALAFRPDHPYLMNYLAYGWAEKGENLDEALTMLSSAASLRPDDGYITDSLGWALFMMGRYDEAVPHLEKAVELLPYDSTLNDHLGDAYWLTGRRLEARFQWERAINAAKDEAHKTALKDKIAQGYQPVKPVREAKTLSEAPVVDPALPREQ